MIWLFGYSRLVKSRHLARCIANVVSSKELLYRWGFAETDVKPFRSSNCNVEVLPMCQGPVRTTCILCLQPRTLRTMCVGIDLPLVLRGGYSARLSII